MIAAPTLTDQPTAPEWWECRSAEVTADVIGAAGYGDPADLTDVAVAALVDEAVHAVGSWHGLADGMPTPQWEQLISVDSFSGHKLHIACASFDDVRAVLARVFEVLFRAGLGCKAATSLAALERGKGVVVYLPRRATVGRDASLVAAALAGYRPSAPVDIFGSERLAGAVWWRHEFGGVDPGSDVWSVGEYRSRYVPAPVPA